jgi:pimeloyl-ACP methyl ester carboxylesterase
MTALTPIDGIGTEILRQGNGRPLVFLHPETGLAGSEAALDRLATSFEIVAPSSPGFGHSELPGDFDIIDDLAYFHLDVLETLDLKDVVLVGNAFGGWLAAEIAIKAPRRVSHLVLANPAGIKTGGREHRDMADVFAMTQRDIDAMRFHDPARAPHFDPKLSSEDEIHVELRNLESAGRFAWSPYMYDPKLARRLHHIRIPTLILWGTSDRIAPVEYGKAFADRIPGARLQTIAEAGRFPQIEQPEGFARAIVDFVNGAK